MKSIRARRGIFALAVLWGGLMLAGCVREVRHVEYRERPATGAKETKGAMGPNSIRMCKMDLNHPWFFENIKHEYENGIWFEQLWFRKEGKPYPPSYFWDRERWNRLLTARAGEGYNAIYFWVN